MFYNLFLNHPVGPRQPNDPEDVKIVQAMLNGHSYATHITLTVDGHYGHMTEHAILQFQRIVLVTKLPDGIIPVWGPILDRLSAPHIEKHLQAKSAQKTSSKLDSYLSDAQYQTAATTLGCEVAVIKAIAQNEAPRGPLDSLGRPTILFEHHLFQRYTKGKWNKDHPDISRSGTTNYGPYNKQYDRLAEAEALDPLDAKMSTSWGAFQIMGFNFKAAGYDSVDAFVTGMQQGVPQQLAAFVAYIKNHSVLLKAVQTKDWFSFALHYNGNIGTKTKPKVRDGYDKRLAAAYAQIVAQSAAKSPPGVPSPPIPLRMP